MLWENKAKEAISQAFYDKTISVLTTTTTTDAEGGVVKTTSTGSTFTGNIKFNALGEIQNDIGLTHEIDIAITCATSTQVAVDDVLQYDNIKYIATEVIPYDSHKLIVGKRWEKQ